jgi:uncharacterized membrane protein
MYSELIIVVNTGKEDSDKVLRTLESRQGGELLVMSDVVLVQRDNQGKSAFQMRWQKADYSSERGRRLAGAFAEAIFGISREKGHRRLIDAGVDPLFLKEVTEAYRPGSTAYLIYVPYESLIDTQRYLKILEAIPGDLYHTTFRPQSEEALMKQNG